MEMLTNILAFVFALGVIIAVHEAGHLVVAKAFDVRVLAYSIGFGKRLFGFKKGETEYFVAAVPLGGYVRMGGELPDEISDDPREFLNKPRWQRIAIYLAGPAMNIVLAIALMTGLFIVGTPVATNLVDIEPTIGLLDPAGAATAAGLQVGDEVVELAGEPVTSWRDLSVGVTLAPGKELEVVYLRDGERLTTRITPTEQKPYGYGDAGIFPALLPRVLRVMPGSPAEAAGLQSKDELLTVNGQPVLDTAGFVKTIQENPETEVALRIRRGDEEMPLSAVPGSVDGKGRLGVDVGSLQRYGPVEAFSEAVRFNWMITTETLSVLGKVITGKISAKSAVSGPLDIASMSGSAARSGFDILLQFMAIISISIAIFNLLPIPLLDGGQIAILLVESLRRRDLPLLLKERIHQVGFFLVIALMATVIVIDITKRL